MRLTTRVMLLLAPILLVGSALVGEGGSGVLDTELSLRKTNVFETSVPEVVRENVSEPGDRAIVPRDFPQQPPVIPHGVRDFFPITFDENMCVECHAVEEKVDGEPTPIPPSHYMDLRRAPEEVRDEVVGARYNCASCHVSPGDNTLLVENLFGK